MHTDGQATDYMKFRSKKHRKRKVFYAKEKWESDREQAEMVENGQNEVLGATTAGPIGMIMTQKLQFTTHTAQASSKNRQSCQS